MKYVIGFKIIRLKVLLKMVMGGDIGVHYVLLLTFVLNFQKMFYNVCSRSTRNNKNQI